MIVQIWWIFVINIDWFLSDYYKWFSKEFSLIKKTIKKQSKIIIKIKMTNICN